MFTAVKDPEVKLVEMVSSLRDESSDWHVLEFNFSQLLEHYRSDYQIKIAVNLIHDLVKTYQGGIFVFGDGDIVLVCRTIPVSLIEKVIFQLRYLFMDDPLSYTRDGQENEKFCRIYTLGEQFSEMLDAAKRRVALLSKVVAPVMPRKQPDAPVRSQIFNASSLASVERDLFNADLSAVMRRQPVCAIMRGSPARRVFDELYVNIQHLRSLLKLEMDLLANRGLFQYLTQILDERMLDMLRQNVRRYFDSPLSLNLNVQTLLSSPFNELDAALKPATKVSIVFEIQVSDVFSDMAAFLVAKDSVQKLGYRVCLDGLTHLSFTQVSRERLGFDLAKLQWNADFESDINSEENQKLVAAIRECGANRVILCRCDSKAAIDYGQAMGISLFQGRYIDTLINPASKIEN